ncbi:prepilin-type N-terminal cleavage/methylation domain-containing protein [Flavobacterium sp. F-65]|uniref:Prepilin-type N-terminal cleavage/methylation domain-containing protein n=1 Tax=Flavobacterium pisciphilum TaxID=2893755 RepID=A0ABS8MQ67_9FLAO|nr:prepilin-type N-terminal cleavage/methylation domain-containing protein [Flavobacterium sp. F-65]MCC9070902.1 prepilin-type N-terminal cleavage/methylation domain-containing protein [Flavobacterium sp. F-65]
MTPNKIKSFTLAELLIVIIITAIVVGMAFSVLRLVQKQIHTIQTNFDKSSNLALFEQKLWQDFNELNTIQYNKEEKLLLMQSEMDTVIYSFNDTYSLRNKDTIKLKLVPNFLFLNGKETEYGDIDAIKIQANNELVDYEIFVSKKNDVTFFINQENGI